MSWKINCWAKVKLYFYFRSKVETTLYVKTMGIVILKNRKSKIVGVKKTMMQRCCIYSNVCLNLHALSCICSHRVVVEKFEEF